MLVGHGMSPSGHLRGLWRSALRRGWAKNERKSHGFSGSLWARTQKWLIRNTMDHEL